MSWQLFHLAPSKYITQNYYFPNNIHKKGTQVRGNQFCKVTAEHKRCFGYSTENEETCTGKSTT